MDLYSANTFSLIYVLVRNQNYLHSYEIKDENIVLLASAILAIYFVLSYMLQPVSEKVIEIIFHLLFFDQT